MVNVVLTLGKIIYSCLCKKGLSQANHFGRMVSWIVTKIGWFSFLTLSKYIFYLGFQFLRPLSLPRVLCFIFGAYLRSHVFPCKYIVKKVKQNYSICSLILKILSHSETKRRSKKLVSAEESLMISEKNYFWPKIY